MYEDIRPPEDFKKAASERGAKTVLVMNQLSDIPYDKAITMILYSTFGQLLRHEDTKAWFSPEYWNYVSICENYGLEVKKPKEYYNFKDLEMLTERFRKRFFEDEEELTTD